MKDQVPEGSEDRILHASLRIGALRLLASDSMVDRFGTPWMVSGGVAKNMA